MKLAIILAAILMLPGCYYTVLVPEDPEWKEWPRMPRRVSAPQAAMGTGATP